MSETAASSVTSPPVFHKVAELADMPVGGRLHVRVQGRFVTLFSSPSHSISSPSPSLSVSISHSHSHSLSAIDSICHHAGGPLTLGPLRDIEELGVTVVLCPWHKFMVSVDKGLKAYQAVEFVGGKPVVQGWKLGKVVQRAHLVDVRQDGIYVALVLDGEECSSDRDACSALCAQDYNIHSES